jgi:hypothetical protein
MGDMNIRTETMMLKNCERSLKKTPSDANNHVKAIVKSMKGISTKGIRRTIVY